jgi:hypothetical protein
MACDAKRAAAREETEALRGGAAAGGLQGPSTRQADAGKAVCSSVPTSGSAGWMEMSRVRVHIFGCICAAPLVPRKHTITTRVQLPRYLAPLVVAARCMLQPSLMLCCWASEPPESPRPKQPPSCCTPTSGAQLAQREGSNHGRRLAGKPCLMAHKSTSPPASPAAQLSPKFPAIRFCSSALKSRCSSNSYLEAIIAANCGSVRNSGACCL